MKIILLTIFIFTSNLFAIEYAVFEVTDNPAFNFFFSFPIWIAIIAIPFQMAINVFRKFLD